MRRFSLSYSLATDSLHLATFGSTAPCQVIGLLAAATVPAYLELVNRGKPTRVYVLHMALFVGLMVVGQASIDPQAGSGGQPLWATIPLLAAIFIRSGSVPGHCWLTD